MYNVFSLHIGAGRRADSHTHRALRSQPPAAPAPKTPGAAPAQGGAAAPSPDGPVCPPSGRGGGERPGGPGTGGGAMTRRQGGAGAVQTRWRRAPGAASRRARRAAAGARSAAAASIAGSSSHGCGTRGRPWHSAAGAAPRLRATAVSDERGSRGRFGVRASAEPRSLRQPPGGIAVMERGEKE